MSNDEAIRLQGDLVVRATTTLTAFSALIKKIETNMATKGRATPQGVVESANKLIDEIDANIRRLTALLEMEKAEHETPPPDAQGD